jgi:hypothetical protein
MSICPSKDIHSIYLDNELPEIYKAEYEAHLKTCPACQKELEKLKKIHEMFSSDSKDVTPDSHYLDQSYERLMVKMKYSRNAEYAKTGESKVKYYIPSFAAAAAALILAVTLPLSLRSGKQNTQNVAELFNFDTQHTSIEEQQNTLISLQKSNSLKRANNIQNISSNVNNVAFTSGRSMPVSGTISKPMFGMPESGSVNKSKVINANDNEFIDYDVFRPNFGEDKISIRITVPGVDTLPVSTEIELPLDVITGQR